MKFCPALAKSLFRDLYIFSGTFAAADCARFLLTLISTFIFAEIKKNKFVLSFEI